MPRTDRDRWVLGAIVLAAAVLRFGMFRTFRSHDEVFHSLVSLRFVTGDFNPNWFGGPGGPLHWGTALFLLLGYLGSWLVAGWSRLEYVEYFREHLELAVVSGRTYGTVCSLATLMLVYRIGRRLHSSGAGLMAAAFLAFCPLHIEQSIYLHKEILATFFLALVCDRTLALHDRPTRSSWVQLGGSLGLLIGVKVTFLTALILPLGVCVALGAGRAPPVMTARARTFGLGLVAASAALLLLLSSNLLPLPARGSVAQIGFMNLEFIYQGREYAESKLRLLGLGLLAVSALGFAWRGFGDRLSAWVTDRGLLRGVLAGVFVFFLFNPYVALNPYMATANLLMEMSLGRTQADAPAMQWAGGYARTLALNTLATGVELLGAAALIWAVFLGKAVERILGVYVLLYVAMIANAPLMRGYWLLSVLPVLYCFAAKVLTSGLERVRLAGTSAVLAAALIAPAAWGDLARMRESWLPDTQELTTEWVLKTVPRGTVIAWTWYAFLPPPDAYLLHDLKGDDVGAYVRLGCRFAAVSDREFAGYEGKPLPGVFAGLARYPVVWECAPDGRTRTGPSIKVYRLDGATGTPGRATP